VPGPDKPLYLRGAEMVATYPASIVTHGQALNITCQSYAGFMNFGYTGCHSSMPSMQRLAVYTAEALAEMEAAFLPHAVVARTPSPRKAAAKPPAKTPAKTSSKTPAKTARAVKPKVPAPTEVVAPAAKPRAARKTA